jgi:eukaryotic-like serine/threonine-protein kinase
MSQGSSEASAQGSDPPSSMTAHGMNAPSTNASALRASDPGLTVDLNPDDVAKAIHRSLHDSNLPVKPPLVPEGYEILGKLGEGTYGEVWKGRHARTGFQVAVKFLRARTSSQLLSLGQEAKKLAMLHSDPHVVRLIDVEEKTTPPYFIMDYAEHGSLAARLDHGPLSLPDAFAIFRKIVEAMAYVHAKGIRHCDLKPGNILLDAADRPKVADFGQSHLSVEATQSALGTFFYMAPEQAAAEKRVPDARWDVFGLGALLYVMLTGAPPRFDKGFKQELEQTAQLSHRLERYRKWVEVSPTPSGHREVKGMDGGLADIIDRCLAANPDARYNDAGELLTAIDQYERRRRSRPMVLFGILAPLLLVTGLGLAGIFCALTANAAADEAEKTFTDHKERVDRMTAKLVADIVKEKLQHLREKMALFAKSASLKEPYLQYLADPRPDNPALAKVEGHLLKLGGYETNVHLFAVYDKLGDLQAAWMRSPNQDRLHPREIYKKDYSYRDYWTHRGDDHGAPPHAHPYDHYFEDGVEVAYVGQPYTSTVDEQFMAITLSMPMYREDHGDPEQQEFIGLLVGCVRLEEFNKWLQTAELANGCVVVLDRRGYCVHHRKECRELYEPKPGISIQPRTSPIYEAVHEGKHGIGVHQDPFDQRTYSAAYEPIVPFGWGVIVQYDHDSDVIRAKQNIEGHMLGLIWVVVALSLTLLAAFWSWLIWALVRKEAVRYA